MLPLLRCRGVAIEKHSQTALLPDSKPLQQSVKFQQCRVWKGYSWSLIQGLLARRDHTQHAINRSPSSFSSQYTSAHSSQFSHSATHSMCNFEQFYTAGNILQKLHDKITKCLTPCSLCPWVYSLQSRGKCGAWYKGKVTAQVSHCPLCALV